MEPQLEDVIVELTTEASLVAVLPLLVHDLEGDVLIRRTRGDPENNKLSVWCWGHLECWRLALVDQVRIEDVELVALENEKTDENLGSIELQQICVTWTILGGGLSKS